MIIHICGISNMHTYAISYDTAVHIWWYVHMIFNQIVENPKRWVQKVTKTVPSDTHAHKSPCKHRVNETWKVNIDTYKRKIQGTGNLADNAFHLCIYSTQIYVNSFCQLTYQFRHSEFHNFTEDPGSQSSTKRLQVLLPGGQGWWMRLRKQVRIHLHSILQWCWQIATKWRLRCYDHHM